MFTDNFQLEMKDQLTFDEEVILLKGLNEEAVSIKGMTPVTPIGIIVRDKSGKVIGGLKGVNIYGSLHIDLLWIDKKWRHRGIGTKLLHEVEKQAKEKKCAFATVNTMDWEALIFYQKMGYQIQFLRDGFEKQSKMYFLRKKF